MTVMSGEKYDRAKRERDGARVRVAELEAEATHWAGRLVDEVNRANANDHAAKVHRAECARIEAMARNLCRICGIDYDAAFLLADKPTVLTPEEIAEAQKFFSGPTSGVVTSAPLTRFAGETDAQFAARLQKSTEAAGLG